MNVSCGLLQSVFIYHNLCPLPQHHMSLSTTTCVHSHNIICLYPPQLVSTPTTLSVFVHHNLCPLPQHHLPLSTTTCVHSHRIICLCPPQLVHSNNIICLYPPQLVSTHKTSYVFIHHNLCPFSPIPPYDLYPIPPQHLSIGWPKICPISSIHCNKG